MFRNFRDEIEVRVQTLKETLRKKLVEKPPNPVEQRRLIGFLVTLECGFDPAWTCLSCHYEFLSNSMKNCFTQFSTSERPKENVLRTPSKLDSQALNHFSSLNILVKLILHFCLQASYPSQVQFIDALSDVFITYFPDFWHLCLDYFNGKFPVKCEFGKQAEVKV